MRYSFYVIVKYEDSLRYQKIFGFVISFIYGNITAKGTFVVSHKFSSSDEEHLPKKLVQANLCVVTGQSKCICFRTSLTWRPRQDETLESPITEFSSFGILSESFQVPKFPLNRLWLVLMPRRSGNCEAIYVWIGLLTYKTCLGGACNASASCAPPCGVVQAPGVEGKNRKTFYPLSFEDRNGWMYNDVYIYPSYNSICILLYRLYHLYSYV